MCSISCGLICVKIGRRQPDTFPDLMGENKLKIIFAETVKKPVFDKTAKNTRKNKQQLVQIYMFLMVVFYCFCNVFLLFFIVFQQQLFVVVASFVKLSVLFMVCCLCCCCLVYWCCFHVVLKFVVCVCVFCSCFRNCFATALCFYYFVYLFVLF